MEAGAAISVGDDSRLLGTFRTRRMGCPSSVFKVKADVPMTRLEVPL